MAPKQQPTTDNGTTSKGKFIATVGGIVSQPHCETDFFRTFTGGSQRHPSAINVQSQLLQMFADMEEIPKQQVLFDYEWELAAMIEKT